MEPQLRVSTVTNLRIPLGNMRSVDADNSLLASDTNTPSILNMVFEFGMLEQDGGSLSINLETASATLVSESTTTSIGRSKWSGDQGNDSDYHRTSQTKGWKVTF